MKSGLKREVVLSGKYFSRKYDEKGLKQKRVKRGMVSQIKGILHQVSAVCNVFSHGTCISLKLSRNNHLWYMTRQSEYSDMKGLATHPDRSCHLHGERSHCDTGRNNGHCSRRCTHVHSHRCWRCTQTRLWHTQITHLLNNTLPNEHKQKVLVCWKCVKRGLFCFVFWKHGCKLEPHIASTQWYIKRNLHKSSDITVIERWCVTWNSESDYCILITSVLTSHDLCGQLGIKDLEWFNPWACNRTRVTVHITTGHSCTHYKRTSRTDNAVHITREHREQTYPYTLQENTENKTSCTHYKNTENRPSRTHNKKTLRTDLAVHNTKEHREQT